MENKYIGIKNPSTGSSNLGLIFEKQIDGQFTCINDKNDKRIFTEEQIKEDLNNNYLKVYHD